MKTLCCLILSALLPACASQRGVPAVHATPNLDRVEGRLWRSGQPSALGIQYLASRGVRTVIDLRDGDGWPGEREECERLGITYTNVPMSGTRTPARKQVETVLSLITGSSGSTAVHCQHGCDRTGLVVACWRVRWCGWSNEDALREARIYGLSPWLPGFAAFIRKWE